MKQERKIAMVVNFVSFKEAEENDDLYFANLSPEERLLILMDLRKTNFGIRKRSIRKVVTKKYRYAED